MKISFYFAFVVSLVNYQLLTAAHHCHNDTERCYWMGNGTKSWEDARVACQSEGGDLAAMETEELWDFVRNHFSFSDTWIGLGDHTRELEWRWLNGDPLRYEKFAPGEPYRINCIQVYSSAQWDDYYCSVLRTFVCSTKAPDCSVLKDGCTDINLASAGKYTGPHGPGNWSTAKSFCEARGQRIMTIDSQEEEDYVNENLSPTINILLGVSDAVVETMFRTSEGFLTPWTNWLDSQPNDARNTPVEDCVVRQVGGLWEDWECSLQWNFYCEAPKMYINGVEEDSENLIDNDADTCVNLTGSDGCTKDKISVRSIWANREITMEIRTFNIPCSDLSVVWRMTWEDINNGNYKKCHSVRMISSPGRKYTCGYLCDVTTKGTTEIKIRSCTLASEKPAICDIKVC